LSFTFSSSSFSSFGFHLNMRRDTVSLLNDRMGPGPFAPR
jgi:hypothetical protein